ncbi:DUF1508 domain-containing protein [Flavobacterium sp. GA093]|uniref:DUF1508 domain-containing protein n=1 Tax=Flavobacterium hydrocarbonoxydans TaxID=2683249 RepID=A0A6I4NKG7_9FLAO|nr:YegP family protein [Flavobacterium hydrocarbonoxydans]MWB93075.1 DUF1508 domain-containing protein [Flavobacterium hydrocarbonoxydans]
MEKFIITRMATGEFEFVLKNENDLIILKSLPYMEKANCYNAINRVKLYSQKEDRFVKKENPTGKYYFNIKGGNGLVIAISRLYDNTQERDIEIQYVKTIAPHTAIIDQMTYKINCKKNK